MKILLASLLFALPVCAQTEAPTPAVPAKFDWKLRLTKGQTWTQTTESHTDWVEPAPSSQIQELDILTLQFDETRTTKFEVLDVQPAFYSIRVMLVSYQKKEKNRTNGKAMPSSSVDTETPLVGASFVIHQSPDGHVVDVLELDDVLARNRKALAPYVAPFPAEEKEKLLSASRLREHLMNRYSLDLPLTPLVLGQTRDDLTFPVASDRRAPMKRTLRALDEKRAEIEEQSVFALPLETRSMRIPSPLTTLSGSDFPKTFSIKSGRVSISTNVQPGSGLLATQIKTFETMGKVTLVLANGQKMSAASHSLDTTTIRTTFLPSAS